MSTPQSGSLPDRVLIDENLPLALKRGLGGGAIHATDLGARLSDLDLWRHARNEGYVLLTKDADFFDRLSIEGAPPKVVWVRTGNLRRAKLEADIARLWPSVVNLLQNADLVEIHADRLEAIRFT
jgi:predicted nuclease of predicted toxin-antitoxin system